MLIVTVEVVDPQTGTRARIHQVEIVNDDSGDWNIGNYDVSWREIVPHRPALVNAKVLGHVRSDGAMWLVKHAIEAVCLTKEGRL